MTIEQFSKQGGEQPKEQAELQRDPFLEELWKRKAEQERGEESIEEKSFKIFLDIKVESEKSPELKKLFEDLQGSILRYDESIAWFDRGKAESWDPKDLENADEARKRAHDALISRLDAFSRQFAKAKLDNSWREAIGFDRETAGEWARNVSQILKASTQKENKIEK